MKPTVKEFFDPNTWTLTYVVFDHSTKDAVIIDPVWDYDPPSSKMTREASASLLEFVKSQNLNVHCILETHAHADHVTGAQILKDKFPNAKIGIGARIVEVQNVFKSVFNLGSDFKTDGSQFDILLKENEAISAGSLKIETLFTPGHTPACSTFVIGDAVFTGDALFMPDSGTGRCDFPSGSASDLYDSIANKIYKLPDHYRVYVGHDYQPNDRPVQFQTTIGVEKEQNNQLKAHTPKETYVQFRTQRDKTLATPRLLLPSIQLNINAGRLPKSEENGLKYLKIPIRE
jgi:glyoxylase-like metal-dependent hydrolase (beta-lactamase superfamily II)